MPSAPRDPKTLGEWLERDYFERPRRLRRWKAALVVLALLLPAAALFAVSFHPRHRVLYQAGPVSTAHAMFNHRCEVCHEESFQPLQRLLHGSEAVRSVRDEACLRCHDGPLHTEKQVRTGRCVECHREHRGHATLARVEDAHCTSCHGDLRQALKPGAVTEFENSITGFAAGRHPEFEVVRAGKDPGRVAFNHAVHLDPEGVLVTDPKQVEEQVKSGLSAAARTVTRKKLECADCHVPDRDGRHMRPIRFEDHCRSCHPLSVQVTADGKDDRLRAAVEAFRQEPAPHPRAKETAEVVRAVMRERYTRFIQEHPAVLDPSAEPTIDRSVPGPRRPRSVTEKEWGWVNDQLQAAERILFGAGGCRKCHEEKAGSRRGAEVPDYEPPAIEERWFAHARFSHDSHRELQCAACHGQAARSEKTSDLLLPGIDTCRQCHNPAVGARTDCVECHGYHHTEERRAYRGDLTIEQLLHGR